MNKAKAMLAALPLGAAIMAGSGTAASAITWPSIGNDSLGPQILITLSGTNSVSITAGPSAGLGPYDGSDDAYIGVVNNTSQALNFLTISSTVSANGGIFGFDNDGIAGYSGQSGNASDSSGYGGPNAYFTNITNQAIPYLDVGDVNFLTPIAPDGGFSYFSLENPLDAASFKVTGANGQPTAGAAPLPASWTMMLIGFAGIGFASYRATKKRSKAIAVV